MRTSRLTPKMGQWRPIMSCQTVLDCNWKEKWRDETVSNEKEGKNNEKHE